MPTPTDEEKSELLLCCRYGELDDIKQFVDTYGDAALADVHDANGNTVLHMVCANGHTDALEYLLPRVPTSLLSAPNAARSGPLHWAALNAHLGAAQALVRFPGGPGIDLIDAKNAAGRTPLGEAEMAGWEEGARWFVEVMRLDDGDASTRAAADVEEEEEELEGEGAGADVEVEIEDADGQIARMSLGSSAGKTGPSS